MLSRASLEVEEFLVVTQDLSLSLCVIWQITHPFSASLYSSTNKMGMGWGDLPLER